MNEYTEPQLTANKAASSPSSSGFDCGTTIGNRLPDVIMQDDDSEHSTNEVGIVMAEPDALDEDAGSVQVRTRSKMHALVVQWLGRSLTMEHFSLFNCRKQPPMSQHHRKTTISCRASTI